MVPTRKSMPRSSRQSDHTKTSWPSQWDVNLQWYVPFIRSGQNHLARHSERGKKTRQTEEEVGRQHQGMDRPGVCQVSEGVENTEKLRKLVVKSSVVPQWPSWSGDGWRWRCKHSSLSCLDKISLGISGVSLRKASAYRGMILSTWWYQDISTVMTLVVQQWQKHGTQHLVIPGHFHCHDTGSAALSTWWYQDISTVMTLVVQQWQRHGT